MLRAVLSPATSSTATETLMRTTRIALLTGVAAMLLAGYAGIADAQPPQSHVITFHLPDGQVEQVRYAGDVPPVVILAPETTSTSFDTMYPFGVVDQMAAAMDLQAEAMFQSMNALMAQATAGFSSVPVMSGPGMCMRSLQISFSGNGQAPHVVSRISGDCHSAHPGVTPALQPDQPLRNRTSNVIEAKAATPDRGLIRTVSDLQR
jgi:phage tail protein X